MFDPRLTEPPDHWDEPRELSNDKRLAWAILRLRADLATLKTGVDPQIKAEIAALADRLAAVEQRKPVVGPTGPRGEQGPRGEPGLAGPSGPKGDQGPAVDLRPIHAEIEALGVKLAAQIADAIKAAPPDVKALQDRLGAIEKVIKSLSGEFTINIAAD